MADDATLLGNLGVKGAAGLPARDPDGAASDVQTVLDLLAAGGGGGSGDSTQVDEALAAGILATVLPEYMTAYFIDGQGRAIGYWDAQLQAFVFQLLGDAEAQQAAATELALPSDGGSVQAFYLDGTGKALAWWDFTRQGFVLQMVGDEDAQDAAAARVLATTADANVTIFFSDGQGVAIGWYDRAKGGFVFQMVGDEEAQQAAATGIVASNTSSRYIGFKTDGQGNLIQYWDRLLNGMVTQEVGDEDIQQYNALEIYAPPLADGSIATITNQAGQCTEYIDPNGDRRGRAGTSTAGYPNFVVEILEDAVRFYFRQGGPDSPTYVQIPFLHAVNTDRNANVWHIWESYEATLTGPNTFTIGQKIVQQGEWEMAIQIADKPDHIGGVLHGNEELTDVYMQMNGARIDHTDPANYGFYEPDNFEVVQASNIFLLGDDDATKWVPKGPLMGYVWKHWTFAPGAQMVRVSNHVEFIDAVPSSGPPVTSYNFDHAYFGMLPILRLHGSTLVTDTASFDPKYGKIDVSVAGFSGVASDTAVEATVWGARYEGQWKALGGWGFDSSDIYISGSAQYNKIYPSWYEVTATAATVWDFEYFINVQIKA